MVILVERRGVAGSHDHRSGLGFGIGYQHEVETCTIVLTYDVPYTPASKGTGVLGCEETILAYLNISGVFLVVNSHCVWRLTSNPVCSSS